MLTEDVLYVSVRDLGERIRNRSISPVELTEAYLDRSKSLGARLNAYVTVTNELARGQARAAEKEIAAGKYRGPLHGIPYAAKDLFAVKGYPTTWGAKPFANQMFDYNATVINRLRDAGAVLIGKAAMIELAGGSFEYRYASASNTGATKNPWNEDYWTCGSSSGSAAIASAALAAFAIGSDTGGSIIWPAAYCGVSGVRPTYGRCSRHGVMALSYSIDKVGPLAKTADDCGLILAEMAGHDSLDRASLLAADANFHYASLALPREPLRIGWLSGQWQNLQPAVEASVREARKTLESAGCHVEEAELIDGPFGDAFNVIVDVEGAFAFESMIESGKILELSDEWSRIGPYVTQQVPATDYLRAMSIRAKLQPRMEEIFGDNDVLAAAAMPITATRIDEDLSKAWNFDDPIGAIGNMCGLPAISVPCGISAQGLPVGLQFIGRVLDDETVIMAANLFQQHTDWHGKRPPFGRER